MNTKSGPSLIAWATPHVFGHRYTLKQALGYRSFHSISAAQLALGLDILGVIVGVVGIDWRALGV